MNLRVPALLLCAATLALPASSQNRPSPPQNPAARPAPSQRPVPGNSSGSSNPGRPQPPSPGNSGNPRPRPGPGGPQIQPVRPNPGNGGPQIQPPRPKPGNGNRPQPGHGNRPNPGRPGQGRPPHWGRPPQNRPSYSFRPNDRDYLRRHYLRHLAYINRNRRPIFTIGGYFPFGDISYLSPLPSNLFGYLPPPPSGYQMGYFDGYVVVYDPVTYFIANLVDLLQ